MGTGTDAILFPVGTVLKITDGPQRLNKGPNFKKQRTKPQRKLKYTDHTRSATFIKRETFCSMFQIMPKIMQAQPIRAL